MTIRNIFSSSLIKNSGLYAISSLINSAIPLLLLPYLTKVLSVEDYGQVAIFMLVQAFMGPFVSMNVHATISRKYFTEDASSYPVYIFNAFLLLILSTITTLLLVFFLSGYLSDITKLDSTWLFAAVISSACQLIILSVLTLLQVQNKPLKYGLLQIILTIVNLLFTFLLIEFYNYKAEGRILAIVYSYVLCAIAFVSWVIYSKQLKFRLNIGFITHAFLYGAPLIPHVVGAIILSIADRLLINKLHSEYEAGLFTVALQLCSVMTIMLSAFNSAFSPWLFRKLKENNSQEKKRIVKFTYLGFLIIALGGFLFSLMLPGIIQLVAGSKFIESVKYINWIIIGIILSSFYILIANYIFYAEKTYLLAMSTSICALAYWPIALFMFNNYGVVGIPRASATCCFLLFIFTWILSARVYKMPWLLK